MDVLLERLKQSNVGCHIGNFYVGCVGYADDVCLVSPSCHATRMMLSVCEDFGNQYNVKFNSSKSQIMLCTNKGTIADGPLFYLNGEVIKSCPVITHLGHTIEGTSKAKVDIGKGIMDLITRTNYVMAKFGCCHSDIRNYLFNTYCTSYYGSSLWDLSGTAIHRFYCTWRKCIRRIWSIPYKSHCYILKYLYGGCDINIQLLSRFLNFYHSALLSDNPIVTLCAKLSQYSNSVVAKNRRLLLYTLNNNGSALECVSVTKVLNDNKEINHVALTIRELCNVRDNILSTDLTSSEINSIIEELCVN